jgi:hypothetical protein
MLSKIFQKQIGHQAVETKIRQNCNKTNSDLCLRNMGIERNHNSVTISRWEENLKKNIWAHKIKPNMESQNQWRIR